MEPWINTPILSSGHGTSMGSFGMTPLHAAAKGGHAEVIDLLIEYGADFEATVAGNLRPIRLANNEGVVMTLVRHGSSIHPQGKSTVPPLTYVLTTKPHLSAIQCLLRLGCNPSAAKWLRFTAAGAAVQTGNVEALQLLLNAKDAPTGYEVQDAGRYLSMAFNLIEHRTSLDAHRESSMLLKFFLSHEYNFPEVLERVFIFLLDRLAGVPISHGQGPVIRPPIHLLFTRGYNFFDTDTNAVIALRLLEYFLYLGADPNEPDSKGNTPLALLCQLPFHADLDYKFYLGKAADKLLCGGADINTLWKAKNCAIYGIVAQVTT